LNGASFIAAHGRQPMVDNSEGCKVTDCVFLLPRFSFCVHEHRPRSFITMVCYRDNLCCGVCEVLCMKNKQHHMSVLVVFLRYLLDRHQRRERRKRRRKKLSNWVPLAWHQVNWSLVLHTSLLRSTTLSWYVLLTHIHQRRIKKALVITL
jgi:hypothetical protein